MDEAEVVRRVRLAVWGLTLTFMLFLLRSTPWISRNGDDVTAFYPPRVAVETSTKVMSFFLVITLLLAIPAAAEATRGLTTLTGVGAVVALLAEGWTLISIETGDGTGYEPEDALFLSMLLTAGLAMTYLAAAFSAPRPPRSREPTSWLDRFRPR